MKKHARYFVRVASQTGSSFCATGWSGFYDNELKYGESECRQHVQELQRKKEYKKSKFEIVREITTETVVETL